MALTGVWDVTIKTPIGSLAVVHEFDEITYTPAGSATLKGETVQLHDLVFDVVVEDDRLTGHSRAGRLPRSAVHGVRISG